MAKYHGKIGYVLSKKDEFGVYREVPVEQTYVGDVIRNLRRLETGPNINDNIILSNQLSIVADAFAYEHFFAIRYASWCGANWKVTTVDVQRPRLILTLGDVYNGEVEEKRGEYSSNSETEVSSFT